MFTKDQINTPLAQLNQLSFFLCYTVFRVLLFPYLTYKCFALAFLTFHRLDALRKFCILFCLVQTVLVTLLQFYWYALILKGVRRLLEERGILQKPNDSAYDDLAQYETNAKTEEQMAEGEENEGGIFEFFSVPSHDIDDSYVKQMEFMP